VADAHTVVYLFLVNSIAGVPVVFLLETEPGVVEFPRIELAVEETESEESLRRRVREATGMEVEISGFLDPPAEVTREPRGSRILLARHAAGSPRITLPHVGWEWTSGRELMRMPFAPKVMMDELRSFMNV